MVASKRILLIEDDAETAELIAEDLQERGYIVSIEPDGNAGLSAILKTEPDLVLCDINMPGMTGFEVMERLIALAPQLDQHVLAADVVLRQHQAAIDPAAVRRRRITRQIDRLDGEPRREGNEQPDQIDRVDIEAHDQSGCDGSK